MNRPTQKPVGNSEWGLASKKWLMKDVGTVLQCLCLCTYMCTCVYSWISIGIHPSYARGKKNTNKKKCIGLWGGRVSSRGVQRKFLGPSASCACPSRALSSPIALRSDGAGLGMVWGRRPPATVVLWCWYPWGSAFGMGVFGDCDQDTNGPLKTDQGHVPEELPSLPRPPLPSSF